MKKIIAGIFVLAAAIYSCTDDNLVDLKPKDVVVDVCDTNSVSFSNDILPLMVAKCGTADHGCHQGSSSSSGYGLESYVEVTATITNSANDYGVPNTFVECLKQTPGLGLDNMPKNAAKLDDCSINKIQAWINQGSLNN
ncbi:MAG: hypothetical protein U0X76_05410 [Bacteroidia bacterium]